MAVSDNLKRLVDQLPNADGRGMYTENIDKEKIEKAIVEIYKGGRENLQGLIEMLGEPGTEENVKPHYGLHCVVNQALIAGDESARKEFCETMCKNLEGDLSTFNKGYLCQELQWAGRDEAVAPLGKLLLDEDLTEPASMALVAIGRNAVDQFLAAVSKADGKCLLNIVDGLAALADPKSANALKGALKDDDREVRIAAGAGLAKMGDAGSADLLVNAIPAEAGWERIQAVKSCMVLAEKLAAAGKEAEAKKIYGALKGKCKDSTEKYIQEACDAAMA
jgi:hypothetical protein